VTSVPPNSNIPPPETSRGSDLDAPEQLLALAGQFLEPPETAGSGLYGTSDDALKAVQEAYHYWTGKLTESSFQLSLGVFAANWAVFGSVSGILSNPWAKGSLFLVLLCLAINLFTAWYMGELHRKIVEHAESNLNTWKGEFSRTTGNDPWPFTEKIENVGRWTRGLKALLPIAAGIVFLIALFCS
jgi:hypothetical protein